MKILIIGSKGFIGSHVSRYFTPNNDVWGADIVISREQNYLLLNKQNTNYERIFDEHKFDICINASGNGSVPMSLNLPVFDFELNVFNTIKLLDGIRMHNPECRFINMSSAAVYGNPLQIPITENSPLKPLSPYGWHKLYAEQICREYYYMYNLQTINLRLFSVYGENLRKQLFWDIYQKCLRSKTVELFGTGNESRDFIYIEDLLCAIDCVIKKAMFNGEVINIASGIETTIQTAASIFVNKIDQEIKLNFNMLVKPGDPLNWRADVELIKSFGFTNRFSMTQGLTNVVKWLKEQK